MSVLGVQRDGKAGEETVTLLRAALPGRGVGANAINPAGSPAKQGEQANGAGLKEEDAPDMGIQEKGIGADGSSKSMTSAQAKRAVVFRDEKEEHGVGGPQGEGRDADERERERAGRVEEGREGLPPTPMGKKVCSRGGNSEVGGREGFEVREYDGG